MDKKIAILFVAVLMLWGVPTYGASIFDIEFPIPELGNCADRAECKAYCNDLANKDACAEFAKKFGLANSGSVEKARSLPPIGPGGCKGAEECRAYCDDASHLDECVQFGERHGLLDQNEIKKAREFAGQTGPGGCRGANECRAYCGNTANQEECLEFANRKGLISDQRAEVAKRVLNEGGPGGCRTEAECRNYCDDPAHIEECVNFAEKSGFIKPEEAARIKKAGLTAGPGGCKGRECQNYCEDPAHQQECIEFAEKNGMMTREEAERARKFAGRDGPGGCRGPEQCRRFCEDPANSDACLEHAEKEGLMTKEEVERARKFARVTAQAGPGGCQGHQQCGQYCSQAENQEECFEFAKKNGLVQPEEERNFEVGKKLNQKLRETGGPGGCKNEGECRDYCSDPTRAEECVAFAAAHGGVPVEQAREMLKQFTERRLDAVGPGGPGGFGPPPDLRRFEDEGRKRFEEFRLLEEQFRGQTFPEFPGGPGGFPGGPEGPNGPGGQGSFPGKPGQFGSGPGEGRFPGGFAGPGGCASPVECIKYCTENKETCFGVVDPFVGGPIGGPLRPQEQGRGGFGEEEGVPRLKSNLIQEFKPGELPEDFHQKSFEERQHFFHEKFGPPPGAQEGFPGRPGEFPGQGGQFPGDVPGGFPGRPGQFEGSREFPGMPPQSGFPGGQGGQGYRTDDFFFGRPVEPFNQGDKETSDPPVLYQKFDGQGGERPVERFDLQGRPMMGPPPSGGTLQPFSPSSGGSFELAPPPSETGGFFQPAPSSREEQSAPPPSSGETQPPPPPPPSSGVPLTHFFGTILQAFLGNK